MTFETQAAPAWIGCRGAQAVASAAARVGNAHRDEPPAPHPFAASIPPRCLYGFRQAVVGVSGW